MLVQRAGEARCLSRASLIDDLTSFNANGCSLQRDGGRVGVGGGSLPIQGCKMQINVYSAGTQSLFTSALTRPRVTRLGFALHFHKS